jgi:chemotaxis protein histidine kinase CheA
MDLFDDSWEELSDEPSSDERELDDLEDEDDLLIMDEEELFEDEADDRGDKNPPMDDSLLCDFIEEAGEHLQEMENNLVRLADSPASDELINDIFRAAHTIKGSSEYIGLHRIAALSHSLENLLDQVRRHEVGIDDQVVDILIHAKDRMEQLVDDLGNDRKEKATIDDLIQAIEAFTASTVNRDETSAEPSNQKPPAMAEDGKEADDDNHPPENVIEP